MVAHQHHAVNLDLSEPSFVMLGVKVGQGMTNGGAGDMVPLADLRAKPLHQFVSNGVHIGLACWVAHQGGHDPMMALRMGVEVRWEVNMEHRPAVFTPLFVEQ